MNANLQIYLYEYVQIILSRLAFMIYHIIWKIEDKCIMLN